MTERTIPLTLITRNPKQPRKEFPQDHIDGLAASIKERGLIQAVLLRPIKRGKHRFEIVAGECRFRAHQQLRLKTIRAVVRELTDAEVALLALVENLQRRDMNPMDEAHGYQALLDAGLDIGQIVAKLGLRSRERVQNRLNLLGLTPQIQQLVRSEQLSTSMASAIALAPLEHQARIVREIGSGRLRTVDHVRHAGQALRDAAAQLDAFGTMPKASPAQLKALSSLESKVDAIADMVTEGFDDGECVAARRVAPDRLTTLADKLMHARKHILDMEHQLRRVAVQTEITFTTEKETAR